MAKMSLKATAILAAALLTGQATATCFRAPETILPDAEVTLISPKGKTLTRVTGTDGMLTLNGLRKGEWQVQLKDSASKVPMTVVRGGKLVIKSVMVRTSCSPPGGPVHSTVTESLRQMNRPPE
jgi:hypothetical protein